MSALITVLVRPRAHPRAATNTPPQPLVLINRFIINLRTPTAPSYASSAATATTAAHPRTRTFSAPAFRAPSSFLGNIGGELAFGGAESGDGTVEWSTVVEGVEDEVPMDELGAPGLVEETWEKEVDVQEVCGVCLCGLGSGG